MIKLKVFSIFYVIILLLVGAVFHQTVAVDLSVMSGGGEVNLKRPNKEDMI